MNCQESLEELVCRLTEQYTKILHIDVIKQHPNLYWGGNGVGDRWANKKFNYSVIYSGKKEPKTYSENEDDKVPEELLASFSETKGNGIVGIYVYSKRTNYQKRPIHKTIHEQITSGSCVVCGTRSDIICDHKNDLYNDERVLDQTTQVPDDFQALCNHCNLQKRQVCREENANQRVYSAKNIEPYKQYKFEFPWEKKAFDPKDVNCKRDTYWYDPVEFNAKLYLYIRYVLPIIQELKRKQVR
jgi:hypothetical protein